jgi:hypothetical protein
MANPSVIKVVGICPFPVEEILGEMNNSQILTSLIIIFINSYNKF